MKTSTILLPLFLATFLASYEKGASTNSLSSSSTRTNSSSSQTTTIPTTTLSTAQYDRLMDAGNTYIHKNDLNRALPLFESAYKLSANDSYAQAQAARMVGTILYTQEKYQEALVYFEQSYKILNKLCQDPHCEKQIKVTVESLASLMGLIYLDYATNATDYIKAHSYLYQTYCSELPILKMTGALHRGFMYLVAPGTMKNLSKARTVLLEALEIARSLAPKDLFTMQKASHFLYWTKLSQLDQFDMCFQELEKHPTQEQLKRAREYLNEAHITSNGIAADLNALLEKEIQESEKSLNAIDLQLAQAQREQQKQVRKAKKAAGRAASFPGDPTQKEQVIPTPITASTVVQSSDIKVLEEMATKLQTLVKEAEIKYVAYRKKPSDGRYQEAEYLYLEALQFARKDPATRKHILGKLSILAQHYVPQEETLSSVAGSEGKEEKREAQTPWLLLDPYGEIAQQIKQTTALKKQLAQLATDYLEIPDAKKLHGFTNLWRARAGDNRIIYTVLPQQHCIGIIKIDDRKDVYEAPQEARDREELFHKQPVHALAKTIEEANARHDDQQVKALIELLKQIKL